MSTRRILTKLLFAVAAVTVFGVSYYLGNRYARPGAAELQAFVFPDPKPLEAFRLLDKKGDPFTPASFKGHWSFLVTGNLDDERCRPLLFHYVLAWNHLAGNPKLQQQTRVVFLDMARTPRTPEQLRRFIDFYNPAFTAVTGPWETRARLARRLGVSQQALETGVGCDPENGVVGLVDPEGVLLALFTGVTDPAAIAHDLKFFQ